MKKVKLNLDTLNVQSFRPSDAPAGQKGTVEANETGPGSCHCQTLEHETCYWTCAYVESCRLFC